MAALPIKVHTGRRQVIRPLIQLDSVFLSDSSMFTVSGRGGTIVLRLCLWALLVGVGVVIKSEISPELTPSESCRELKPHHDVINRLHTLLFTEEFYDRLETIRQKKRSQIHL